MPKSIENGPVPENGSEDFSEEACRKRILDSLQWAGLKEKANNELIDRLILLEQGSLFNHDARQIETGVSNVMNYLELRYAEEHPEFRLSLEQRISASVAALLHDAGKSGPAEANADQQRAVISVFAMERVNDVNRSIKDVVAESFTEEEAGKLLDNLSACGINPKKTMRHFYDQHAYWTHDILVRSNQGVNDHVRVIAGHHHINSGINPFDRKDKPEPPEILKIQGDEADNLSVKVLMVVDKYQARLRRSGDNHDQAMDWVKRDLIKYGNDEKLQAALNAVDDLGGQGKIFG